MSTFAGFVSKDIILVFVKIEGKENNERNWERSESGEGRENGNEVRPELSANVSSTNTSCIWLQTGTAEVGDVDGNSFVFPKILFDSGSQRSHVNEELARCLDLSVGLGYSEREFCY